MSNFGTSLFKSNTNDSEVLKQQIQQSEQEKAKQTILPTELFKSPSAVKSSVFKGAQQIIEKKVKTGGMDEDAEMDDESGEGG